MLCPALPRPVQEGAVTELLVFRDCNPQGRSVSILEPVYSPLHSSPELEQLLSLWNGKYPDHSPLGQREEKGGKKTEFYSTKNITKNTLPAFSHSSTCEQAEQAISRSSLPWRKGGLASSLSSRPGVAHPCCHRPHYILSLLTTTTLLKVRTLLKVSLPIQTQAALKPRGVY